MLLFKSVRARLSKRIAPDTRYAVGDGYARKRTAIRECVGGNHRRSIFYLV